MNATTTAEAQWHRARELILGENPQLRILPEISTWHRKIELFREGEGQRMLQQDPTPEDLAVHKSLLQRLIADGQHLLSLVHQVGLPENREGITPESVAATVELLEADYRGWHQPMLSAQRNRVLKAVFPDVP